LYHHLQDLSAKHVDYSGGGNFGD